MVFGRVQLASLGFSSRSHGFGFLITTKSWDAVQVSSRSLQQSNEQQLHLLQWTCCQQFLEGARGELRCLRTSLMKGLLPKVNEKQQSEMLQLTMIPEKMTNGRASAYASENRTKKTKISLSYLDQRRSRVNSTRQQFRGAAKTRKQQSETKRQPRSSTARWSHFRPQFRAVKSGTDRFGQTDSIRRWDAAWTFWITAIREFHDRRWRQQSTKWRSSRQHHRVREKFTKCISLPRTRTVLKILMFLLPKRIPQKFRIGILDLGNINRVRLGKPRLIRVQLEFTEGKTPKWSEKKPQRIGFWKVVLWRLVGVILMGRVPKLNVVGVLLATKIRICLNWNVSLLPCQWMRWWFVCKWLWVRVGSWSFLMLRELFFREPCWLERTVGFL